MEEQSNSSVASASPSDDGSRETADALIAALAEVKRLREALLPFSVRVPDCKLNSDAPGDEMVARAGMELEFFRNARAALTQQSQAGGGE